MAAIHTFLLCLALVRGTIAAITNPTVKIDSGELKGLMDDSVVTDGVSTPRTITKFLGVPFAAPPVGELRFKAPQPVTAWDGSKDAVEFGDMCMQHLNTIFFNKAYQDIFFKHNRTSENCLTLNIFSPIRPEVSQNPIPVMVYIHGGAFKWGSGMQVDGTQLALHGNVIVVTMNYRLNAFGFMSIGGDGADTNLGLRDQIMALKWVKTNIAHLGGDPDRVTIFGNSAGGVSATLLVASPLGRGLFNRAILQSGTVNYKHLLKLTEGHAASRTMAKTAGCNQSDTANVLKCLRSLQAENILTAWSTSSFAVNPIVPHFGDDVIPAEPGHLFRTGQVSDVEVMIGGNKHDGVGSVPGPVLTGQVTTMDMSTYETNLENTLKLFYPVNTDKVLATVAYNYGKDTTTDDYRLSYLEAQTDRVLFGFQRTADRLKAAGRTVYFYMFTHTPSVRHLPWPAWVVGGHGDEEQFVFGNHVNPDGGTSATADEKTLSRQMMTAWTNFAAKGDPNIVDTSISPALNWPQYTKEKRQYIEFNIKMDATSARERYRAKELDFWREVVPEVATADSCIEVEPPVDSDQKVNTKQGMLQGVKRDEKGKMWEEYLGIPYAAPPRRWRAPKPHPAWSGVRNATQYGAQCYEFLPPPLSLPDWLDAANMKFSEDCLFLNIFVPRGVAYVRYMDLPVMIWIHGKAYNSSRNGFFPGHGLALFGSVIVVTVNFRMGALGYLPAGLTNYALHDQHLAIKWVYENIANFGGDPKKITLVGQSAGAVTATLQAVSPANKGMIKNVIAESGSPFSPWGMNKYHHMNEVKTLADKLGCSSKDSEMMLNCLRDKDVLDITSAHAQVSSNAGYWGPIVDGGFIPKDPTEMIEEGALKEINFIVGSNFRDGYEMASHFSEDDVKTTESLSNSLSDIINALFVNHEVILATIKYQTLEGYGQKSEDEKMMTVTTLMTNMMYNAPARLQAEVQTSAGGKVYLYNFKHRTGLQAALPSWVQGNHMDEGYYVMGGPLYFDGFSHSADDEKLSADIMTYWTNFAKYGDPNKGYQVSTQWPHFTPEGGQYVELSSNLMVETEPRAPYLYFWNKLIPTLEGSTHGTCPARTTDTTTKSESMTTTSKSADGDGDGDGRGGGKDGEEECVKSIGPLRLNAWQAHQALWVLGLLCGFLFIFGVIMVAHAIYQHRKFKSRMFSGRRGTDNNTFTSAM